MTENSIVNLLVDEDQDQVLKRMTSTLPDVILNERQICVFELLVTGVFSPLTGFMTRVDYESVLHRICLASPRDALLHMIFGKNFGFNRKKQPGGASSLEPKKVCVTQAGTGV